MMTIETYRRELLMQFLVVSSMSLLWVQASLAEPGKEEGNTEGQENVNEALEAIRAAEHLKVMARIEGQGRLFDPFGLPMTAEGTAMKDISHSSEEEAPSPESGDVLQEALDKITVNGVMLGSKSIMLGGRFIRPGKIVNVSHQGIRFRVRFDNVLRDQLRFTDMETGQQVSRSLNVLPSIERRLSNYKPPMTVLPSGSSPMQGTISVE